jgi:hypothetical protein
VVVGADRQAQNTGACISNRQQEAKHLYLQTGMDFEA